MKLLVFVLAIVSALVALSSGVAVERGSCSYGGKSYPHNPSKEVQGDTHTCVCRHGVWSRCKKHGGSKKEDLLFGGSEFVEMKGGQETALEARQEFSDKDFVLDFKGQIPDSTGLGGTIRVASLAEWPSLAGQGVSASLFKIDPCGINLPHVHPRATELLYVIKASKLRVAFVEENSGRTIVNDIQTGHITFFPEGLVHYQQNLGCEPAEYISSLNSEDPGVVTLSERIFTLPTEALQATFNLNAAQIEIIKKGIPAGPAKGRIECLKRCGLWEK